MNAIIDMYMKCRCIEKAVEVFEGMQEKAVDVHVFVASLLPTSYLLRVGEK